jgi:hypothetical protein
MQRGPPRPCDGASLRQPFPYRLSRHPRHANHCPAATLAGRYGNGGSRNVQKICEEFDAGVIGSSIDRRGGQRQFEGIANFTSEGVLLGSRTNSDRETYAGWGFVNRNQLELEVPAIRCPSRAFISASCRQHADNPSQTFPCRLIQCGIGADEIANHVPRGDIKGAFGRWPHGERDRALRTKANPLG